jgi:hypothetical protein
MIVLHKYVEGVCVKCGMADDGVRPQLCAGKKSPETRKACQNEVTWKRLGALGSLLSSAVEDVRRGVEEKRGYRVSLGLLSIMSTMPEALRLLGRIDQGDEDRVAGEAEQEHDRAMKSIRNIAMIAGRLRKIDPESAEHLLRFCREAGWKPSILREGDE